MTAGMSEEEIYEKAKKRVEDKRGFFVHFTVYIVVNIMLALIWAFVTKGFPWFLFGYVVMAFLRGFGFFSPAGIHHFTVAGKFLILVGMCGIGLNTDFRNMCKLGWRPFLAGFMASALVALIALLTIYGVGIR